MNPKILQIDGWMHPIELEWLFHIAQKVPEEGVIVELGAWKGRSSAALYEGAGNKKNVVSIDTWRGQKNLVDFDHSEVKTTDIFKVYIENMRQLGFNPKPSPIPYEPHHYGPQYIISDSVEASKYFQNNSVDWIFIDADHTKTGEDIDAWLPKMKTDGLMTGHDYFSFYETIQQEIHKRFYIHQIIHSIWVRYLGLQKPDYL